MALTRRMILRTNTMHNDITALNNGIEEFNRNMLTVIFLLKEFKEELYGRDSKRNIIRDEDKRKKSRKPKEVCND